MARQLDQTRPYSTFYPQFEGAMYEQDGLRFDAQGNLIGQEADAEAANAEAERLEREAATGQPVEPEPEPPRRRPRSRFVGQVAAQLADDD